MDPALTGLIGAGIGGLVGLIGAVLNSRQQQRLEDQRWYRARHDVVLQELKAEMAGFARTLAAVLHTMEWLTWIAREHPERITTGRLAAYSEEMNRLWPELTGASIVIAALDQDIYRHLAALTEKLHSLDLQIGEAALVYEDSPNTCARALAACYEDAVAFDRELPAAVADMIRSAMTTSSFEAAST
ncbi:MAG: hypothetical protein D6791_11190 [Chloroflexi bacterium]|nr:MAG: hypothetical protein D6791_11190 [Chloroflexota bacterium]